MLFITDYWYKPWLCCSGIGLDYGIGIGTGTGISHVLGIGICY